MSEARHTPTPYRLWRPKTGDMRGMEVPQDMALVGANDIAVGVLYGDLDEVRLAQSYIVRAVNCHDELLAALKDILPMAEAYLKSAPSHPDHSKLETARAAISKASGQQS